jgi:UDP-N-acetylmuramoyl-tripeptide--D-alanyl-D-alanine ligase
VIATTAGALPGCTVVRGAPATPIAGVEMDSRLAGRGSLFVAIRGGHAHTADARAQGCAAVLVEDGRAARETEGVVLAAPDTVAALQRIGAANRAASAATVVGVTGSSGKTSTKDVLAALVGVERHTIAAAEGHNNEIGLPFTLTRIAADTEVAVCELSMRGPGQITELAELARPEIGVITNVGEAHLELLGSREAIAAAKAELLDYVEIAVVPAGEPLLGPHLRDRPSVITFGEEAGADVRVAGRAPAAAGMTVTLVVDGRPLAVETNLTGRHNALNLAAAIGVCRALGLDLAACARAATRVRLQRWRSEEHPLPGGGLAVNDAYNANPSSMEAALASLAERPGSGRLVAVLGVMAELGPDGPELHRRVGAAAADLGYTVLVAVGEPARAYLDGAGDGVETHLVADREQLVAYLADVVRPDDRVLVKASRSAGLEQVAAGIAARLANGAAT